MERDDARAVATRAADYTKLRRGAAAERMLRAALTSEPGNGVLLIELARALHAQKRHDEALSAAESGTTSGAA
ncbi:tetratricopeptide repeat protein [Stackebrandtia nassauensis]|uniref:Uncharacterized protein n=1 Tax=Stackebrandtia nassauensis (strain DSM 44728 / CIP 108903 / NRRL B-16338 / NBRC 102104 / LLR-40K-21) TaxID=446470 RepID=D3Q4K3_STANL|nr:tetratricopeptide repeat protein [Stackebrandtia nassauensis]ADD40163.1 hypothetical protein Snas_0448 [Stackebrandtia nassauensis DSM 44728]